jgi:hypothetical protein
VRLNRYQTLYSSFHAYINSRFEHTFTALALSRLDDTFSFLLVSKKLNQYLIAFLRDCRKIMLVKFLEDAGFQFIHTFRGQFEFVRLRHRVKVVSKWFTEGFYKFAYSHIFKPTLQCRTQVFQHMPEACSPAYGRSKKVSLHTNMTHEPVQNLPPPPSALDTNGPVSAHRGPRLVVMQASRCNVHQRRCPRVSYDTHTKV